MPQLRGRMGWESVESLGLYGNEVMNGATSLEF